MKFTKIGPKAKKEKKKTGLTPANKANLLQLNSYLISVKHKKYWKIYDLK